MERAKMTWIVAAAGTVISVGLAAQPPESKPSEMRPSGQPSEIKPSMAHEEGATLNFDKDQAGKLPMGWKAGESPTKALPGGDPAKDPPKDGGGLRALWTVSPDPTAPSSPNVLEILGSTQGVNGYNICICERHSHKDVDLTARLRGNTGKIEQGGGVAWRVRNADNFYGCAYNPADGKFRVFKVIDGREQELGTADFKGSGPDASTWYTINARMSGDTITCSINGQELLHATDATLKDAGHIGLWARADAATSFDDVMVKAAGGQKKEKERPDMPPKGGEDNPPKGD